jgi:nuclear pore complex protein Nup54
MVPALAVGWGDVKKRVQLQEQIASVHQEKIKVGQGGDVSLSRLRVCLSASSEDMSVLTRVFSSQEISLALSQLTRQTSLSSSIRLASLQTSLTHLLHRLIHLASLTPQFIPILQSTSFRPEEAETRERLDSIKSELDGRAPSRAPGARLGESSIGTGNGTPRKGQGRMLGQVNELWGAVEEIRRRRRGGRPEGREAWLADEKVLAEVAEVSENPSADTGLPPALRSPSCRAWLIGGDRFWRSSSLRCRSSPSWFRTRSSMRT